MFCIFVKRNQPKNTAKFTGRFTQKTSCHGASNIFSSGRQKKKKNPHNLVLSEKTDLQRARKGLMGLRIGTLDSEWKDKALTLN